MKKFSPGSTPGLLFYKNVALYVSEFITGGSMGEVIAFRPAGGNAAVADFREPVADVSPNTHHRQCQPCFGTDAQSLLTWIRFYLKEPWHLGWSLKRCGGQIMLIPHTGPGNTLNFAHKVALEEHQCRHLQELVDTGFVWCIAENEGSWRYELPS